LYKLLNIRIQETCMLQNYCRRRYWYRFCKNLR
jgi:hypothetical protein